MTIKSPAPGGVLRAGPVSFKAALNLLNRLPRGVVLGGGLGAVVVLGLFDWLTGPAVQPSFVYVLIVIAVSLQGRVLDGSVVGAAAVVAHLGVHAVHPDAAPAGMLITGWSLAMCLSAAALMVVAMAAVRRVIDRLESLASVDPLTGVHNLRFFLTAAERERARSLREGTPISLAFLDLDRLKATNDIHGHETGDRLLQAFADVVAATVRPYDLFGRLGGDEFVLLLPNTGQREAMGVMERVRRELFTHSRGGIDTISASAGVVTFPTPPADVRSMIRVADQLMYRAKRAGGGALVGEVWNGRPRPTETRIVVDVMEETLRRIADR